MRIGALEIRDKRWVKRRLLQVNNYDKKIEFI